MRMAERKKDFDYFEEIECYFLKAYYIQTLYMVGKWKMPLEIEEFRKIQYTVNEKFPDWRHNRYFQGKDSEWMRRILETCEKNYSEEEIMNVCQWVANSVR